MRPHKGRIFHLQRKDQNSTMTSQAKLTANRANAKLSTGPRSPEGKIVVAQNASKHNLTSIQITIPDEDRREFQTLVHELTVDLKPLTSVETALVQQAAYAEWRLLRIARWESEIITAALSNRTAPAQRLFGKTSDEALTRLHRYETQIRRAWHNALKELRLQQRIRASAPIPKPAVSKIMAKVFKSMELHNNSENNQTNPTALNAPPSPTSNAALHP
jgi:hypothetical protein